jgi:putative CocE/NonD family hydrolase
MAKIMDVDSAGRARKLGAKTVGVVRARFRKGYDRERPLVPGAPDRFRIELFDLGHAFLPGHRIRIDLSSSASPAVAPNPNTGRPIGTDTSARVARQTVYHDRAHPSHLVLPVLPRVSPR